MIRPSGRYDAPVSESLTRAFPARLAPAVANVAQSLPDARLRPAGSVTESQSRTWPDLVVTGEVVTIPQRIYNPEPSPHVLTGLSDVEALVTAAIYSRHHDGFVRQRQLATLLEPDEPWTASFIAALLGEYVLEISRDIEQFARTAFPGRPAVRDNLSAFFRENPCFTAPTRQRAISYWSFYHRGQYPSQETYPALAALSILTGSTTI
jgi:hypothetical protein